MSELGAGNGSSYPGGLDTDNVLEVNSPNPGKTKARAEVPNDLAAAIIAIETELGTDPAGSVADVKTFLQTEHATNGIHTVALMSMVKDEDDMTSDSAVSLVTQQSSKAYADVSFESRALFTDNDGATPFTFLVDSASYFFSGTKAEFISWDGQLTTVAAGAPGANVQMYLYLDDTAIAARTGMTLNKITDTSAPAALIWSTTAPTYSQAKHGFYNGEDRCIFAAKANASDDGFVLGYHDGGDYVQYDVMFTDRALADLDDTWTDVTLTAPGFSTRAKVTFKTNLAGGANTILSYRVNGSSGAGHEMLSSDASDATEHNSLDVFTDSSQKIEIVFGASDANQAAVFTNGWYLPKGL